MVTDLELTSDRFLYAISKTCLRSASESDYADVALVSDLFNLIILFHSAYFAR